MGVVVMMGVVMVCIVVLMMNDLVFVLYLIFVV